MQRTILVKFAALLVAIIFIPSTLLAAPPGLTKGHYPQGLHDQTPPGWSKGKKTGWHKTYRGKKVKYRNVNPQHPLHHQRPLHPITD